MKHGRKWIVGLIALSIVITAVLVLFMPDQIPAHYNSAGVVDRMGSKYESFIWPAAVALCGAVLLPMARFVKKGASEEKVFYIIGAATELFLLVLGIFFMVKSIVYNPATAGNINADVTKISTVGIGILLIVLGNFMPKISRNKMFGLRTPWTQSSDTVWQKSNRFCGICGVVCGLAIVLSSALLSSAAGLVVCIALFLAWIILSVIASYFYYKKEPASPQ